MIDSDKAKNQAEQLNRDIDQATRKVDEAKGQVRETIAGVTGAVNRRASEIQQDVAAAVDQTASRVGAVKGQAQDTFAGVTGAVNRQATDIQRDVNEAAANVNATIAGLDRTTLALASGAAAILLTLAVSIVRDRLMAPKVSPLQRHGENMLKLGREQASRATSAAEQTAWATTRRLENKLADQLEDVAGQIRAQSSLRRSRGMGLPGGATTPMVLVGIGLGLVALIASTRHAS